jgi:hypothetical protein
MFPASQAPDPSPGNLKLDHKTVFMPLLIELNRKRNANHTVLWQCVDTIQCYDSVLIQYSVMTVCWYNTVLWQCVDKMQCYDSVLIQYSVMTVCRYNTVLWQCVDTIQCYDSV